MPTEKDTIRPPDLGELVERFGGYHKITPEGWAEWDAAVAEFHERLRRRRAQERG
jgi:hypothetical protein